MNGQYHLHADATHRQMRQEAYEAIVTFRSARTARRRFPRVAVCGQYASLIPSTKGNSLTASSAL
jgi:hypothetical protein